MAVIIIIIIYLLLIDIKLIPDSQDVIIIGINHNMIIIIELACDIISKYQF